MVNNTDDLIDVLKKSRLGFSINKIAEKTGWHRNTVTKYLNILEQEGRVFSREIGQYKLWLYQELRDSSLDDEAFFVLKAYELLLKNLKKLHPEINDGKEIGRLIASELDLENYISIDFNELVKNPNDLTEVANTLMDALNNIYFITYEKYEFDPPIINRIPAFIILRIKNTRYVEIPLHFEILTGLVEEKIKQLFSIKVNVSIHEIFLEKKIVDIKISF